MRKVKNALFVFFTMLATFLAGSWFYPNDVPQDDEPYVAIIYGYSFFLKDATTTGVYIDRSLPYLLRCKNLKAIVVSGGVTRPTEHPNESEAGLMRAELLARGVKVPIYIEDRSMNTGQNAVFSLEVIKRLGFKNDTHLLIFADQIPMPKIVLISWWYVLQRYSVKHFAINLWSEHAKIMRLQKPRPAR